MKVYLPLSATFLFLFFSKILFGQVSTATNSIKEIEDYVYSNPISRKESKKIFQEIERLSESADAEAACLLGVFYKDGIGTKLDFNKARTQFEYAYALGNSQAAYSLGYLYLKGLGNIGQDYQKAISWFTKSDYPMAKHWLAKMNYFGLGMPMNKQKAIEMLAENPIGNSQVLLGKLEYEMLNFKEESQPKGEPESSETLNPPIGQTTSYQYSDSNAGLAGKWVGEWEFMDWSGEKLMRSVPFEIELTQKGAGNLDGKIVLENIEYKGEVIQSGNELIFPDFTISLTKDYTDYVDELALDYRLTSFVIDLQSSDLNQFMIGNLEANIVNWSEPAPPNRLLLRREGTLSDINILNSLAEQSGHFIKVYPNPFEDNLLLHYTLTEDTNVSVTLTDYYRPINLLRHKQKIQEKGEQIITFDGLDYLPSGLYLVNMTVGSERYTRIVIKK